MYHRFRVCPVLVDTIRSRYAYQRGKIDPKRNPDSQQPEGGYSHLDNRLPSQLLNLFLNRDAGMDKEPVEGFVLVTRVEGDNDR